MGLGIGKMDHNYPLLGIPTLHICTAFDDDRYYQR